MNFYFLCYYRRCSCLSISSASLSSCDIPAWRSQSPAQLLDHGGAVALRLTKFRPKKSYPQSTLQIKLQQAFVACAGHKESLYSVCGAVVSWDIL